MTPIKKNTFFIVAALSLTFLRFNVYAQTKIDCSKANTQTDINFCLEQKYLTADKELNDLYKRIIAKLSGEEKLTLIQSQRTWVKFRDQYSKIYELIYEGGSVAPSVVWECKTTTTRARIIELKQLLGHLNL